jgi:peptidoglycan hydrolase-like protein with peptidoglycan-binding domain
METAMTMLRQGSQGRDVRELQRRLNLILKPRPALAEDGLFGPKTQARVIEFQGRKGLSPDGVVGPKTEDVLVMSTPQVSDVAYLAHVVEWDSRRAEDLYRRTNAAAG